MVALERSALKARGLVAPALRTSRNESRNNFVVREVRSGALALLPALNSLCTPL
jgi:hypothetical protein